MNQKKKKEEQIWKINPILIFGKEGWDELKKVLKMFNGKVTKIYN